MINICFYTRNSVLIGFEVSGHAGFAEYGSDIVCAAVTSAVQLVCNGVSDIINADAKINMQKNLIKLTLNTNDNKAISFLNALRLHFDLLKEDYPNNLKITIEEDCIQ